MDRVKDYPELRKDGAAIINVDTEQYRLALKRKKARNRIQQLESDVSELKNGMNQILELLSVQVKNAG